MSKIFWANGRRAWDEQRRAYRCDWCGRIGRWDDNWQWYGSLIDMDAGNEHHLCSLTCVSAWSARRHGSSDGVEYPRALVLTDKGEVRP